MKNKKENDISFLGKIIYYCRSIVEKIRSKRLLKRLIDREKKIAGYSDVAPSSDRRATFAFRIARLVSLVLLCIIILSVLLFGGNTFSYESIYYMFKDINYISSFSESPPETLNYSEALSKQDFSDFKNGLAVVSDSEIKFFTSTGRVTMTAGSSYTNPKITCSSDTALIYDSGRNSFAVYNSFIQLYSEDLDYPIISANMSDSGRFAIVTKSKKYNSVVKIYDTDYSVISEYSKNDYIISVSLSSNGKYCAVTSLDARHGESVVSMNIFKVGTKELYGYVEIIGAMPYSCSFLSNDRVALFCTDRSFVFDLRGNEKKGFIYPSSLLHLSIDGDKYAMVFKGEDISGGNSLYVFDRNGNTTFFDVLKGTVSDIAYKDGFLYLLRDGEAVRKTLSFPSSEISIGFMEEEAKLLVFDNGEVMVCTPAVAYFLKFY